MTGARIIQAIQVEEHEGNGTRIDPNRIVMRYYTLDGEFLAKNDNWNGGSDEDSNV